MRILNAALTTAQRAANRRPYLQVTISDRFAGIRRLMRLTQWYSGAEPQGPHGAAVPTDGSLNRLRVDPGANILYRQRVTTPGAGSDYTVWTSFRTATRLCAVAQYGANLVAFAVDNATPTQIYTATSADNGASWSAFALAITHAVTITCIAAAAKSNGNIVCVVNNGNNVSAYKYTGSWGAAVTTTDGAVTPLGLACSYGPGNPDFQVLCTGTIVTPVGSRLYARIYGDGYSQALNTWSVARTITESNHASGLTFAAPFLSQPDTFRATAREQFTGTGAYDRTVHTQSPATADFAFNYWKEPTPLNIASTYGLAITYDGANLFLTAANRVLNHPLSVAFLDLTPDVLSADINDAALSPAPSTIELLNASGAYNAPPEPITLGAEVRVSPGYYVADNTVQVSSGQTYWISAIEHDFTSQPPVLRLTLLPLPAVLAAWAAPRTVQYAAGEKNVFGILANLFAAAGFEFSSGGGFGSGSSGSANAYPAITIPAGQDGLTAARRVLARTGDTIAHRGEFGYLTNLLASEASDASYKWQGDPATFHSIATARYRDRLKPSTHVRAVGGAAANVIGESIDFPATELQYINPRLLADRELDTAVKASDRAAAIARDHELASRADTITAPVHCGLEMTDMIDVTDSRVGLTAVKRRVTTLRLRYRRRGQPTYVHEITLGEP